MSAGGRSSDGRFGMEIVVCRFARTPILLDLAEGVNRQIFPAFCQLLRNAEVAKDLLHQPWVINHRDDAHRALADGAAQRVNMPDAQNQVAPPLGG